MSGFLSTRFKDSQRLRRLASNSSLYIAPPPALTWDAAAKGAAVTLSNDNIDATTPGGWQSVLGTLGKAAGKWQFEVKVITTAGNQGVGIADRSNLGAVVNTYLGQGTLQAIGYLQNYLYIAVTGYGPYTAHSGNYSTNDIVTCALDLDASPPRCNIYKNGALIIGSNLPTGKTWYPAACMESAGKMRLIATALSYPVAGFAEWG